MKIGVFDSGVGGLTILRSFVESLPQYDYIYLGDVARAPYGNRSPEAVFQFTLQAVEYLFKNDCALVILACNTASALALRRLQQEWLPKNYPDRRILGVVIPIVEAVIKKDTRLTSIGLIATRATIESSVYKTELDKRSAEKINLLSQPCPLLVPMIEEGWHETIPAKMILKKYLRPLKTKKIKTLILGCTHYPLLMKDVRQIMGKSVTVINSGPIVAKSLIDYLSRHTEIDNRLSKKSQLEIHYLMIQI